MSSTLSYNSKARWLHSLENHVQNYKTESITWATSMIRLGGLYELPRLLVDDMYRAHIDNPITICTIGLSRIQYLRYCFYMKPDALVSSKSDIMHQLLFAPQGRQIFLSHTMKHYVWHQWYCFRCYHWYCFGSFCIQVLQQYMF